VPLLHNKNKKNKKWIRVCDWLAVSQLFVLPFLIKQMLHTSATQDNIRTTVYALKILTNAIRQQFIIYLTISHFRLSFEDENIYKVRERERERERESERERERVRTRTITFFFILLDAHLCTRVLIF
jgi:hypothetical protein